MNTLYPPLMLDHKLYLFRRTFKDLKWFCDESKLRAYLNNEWNTAEQISYIMWDTDINPWE